MGERGDGGKWVGGRWGDKWVGGKGGIGGWGCWRWVELRILWQLALVFVIWGRLDGRMVGGCGWS